METNKSLVVVLLGPTASGKTNLAIELAEKLQLEIHNIDSRQLYIDMDIGTAKPTKSQQKRVHHYLIDLKQPNEKISLHEFKELAESSIEKALNTNKIVFLVGGSGLYLKSITGGLTPPSVPPQKHLRGQLSKLNPIE